MTRPNPKQAAYRKAARAAPGWTRETRLDDVAGHDPTPALDALRPRATPPEAPGKVVTRKVDLTDTNVKGQRDFAEGRTYLLHDFGGVQSVAGLRVRIGARRVTFLFYSDVLDHGERRIVSRTLGHFPELTVADARKAALQVAAETAGGRAGPGLRNAVKLGEAMQAYIVHLRSQAAKRGKAATWAKNCISLARNLDEYAGWTLAELSDAPAELAAWHRRITKRNGPTTANQSAKILRACYKRAARLDRSLPTALPTSAIEYNEEARSQAALAFGDFPVWFEAWKKIENPIRRAFQRCNLLTGCRPGELSRLKWSDVLPAERRLVIRGAKTGSDISVPLSAPIARALKLARDAARVAKVDSEFVFYSRDDGHVTKFDHDDLPAHGMELRRAYRTLCADLEVDGLISHFLLGHRPSGISQGYISKLMLVSGPAMRKAQRKISQRIELLLAGRK
jgi:integrase